MLINIDELLKSFGMNRELLIQKNPKYEGEFVKLDGYYQRYKDAPSESLANAVNSITIAFMGKLKDENADMFKLNKIPQKEIVVDVKDKFSEYKKDLFFLMDSGDQDAIDDLFNSIGQQNTIRLITFENFTTFQKALKGKNSLIISHLFDVADKNKILPDVILGRDGEILNLIFATKNLDLIKSSVEVVKDHDDAPDIFRKNMLAQQAIELGDEEVVSLVENVEEKSEGEAAPKKKATESIKQQTPLQQTIDMIKSGKLTMDVPLVSRLERKFAIRILDTQQEIATGKSDTYKFIVPTDVSKYFDAKVLFSDNDFIIYEAKKTDFERQFGVSVYELAICWFNMLNLLSPDDVISLFYLANISSELLVNRDNVELRKGYLEKLKAYIKDPDTNNKINSLSHTIKETSLVSLKKSGFLDDNFCPTKMLYSVMVLHSFPFPAYTHPFEQVKIDNLLSMFQFKVSKGDYGKETFYTDGDLLFHNFNDTGISKFASIVPDSSRTTILNLKSSGRAGITKKSAVINHFIPFIYTIPSRGHIPKFSIRMLGVGDRKINWGIYELGDEERKVYVNSYSLSSVMINLSKKDYNLATYTGNISSALLGTEGVILERDNTHLVIRGIRSNEFLPDNFGKNWKAYYAEMFSKNHLNKEVLDKIDPDMVKAIFGTVNVFINSVETGLYYGIDREAIAAANAQKEVEKAEAVKKAAMAKKDSRVYIDASYAKQKVDDDLMPVFNKIQNLRGEERDEAILDEMYARNIEKIFPSDLIYMGFGLKEYITDKPERVNFKNKYRLRIPILLSFKPAYYLEKI